MLTVHQSYHDEKAWWELLSYHEYDCFYYEGGGFPVVLRV